jgi:hypothetical protein
MNRYPGAMLGAAHDHPAAGIANAQRVAVDPNRESSVLESIERRIRAANDMLESMIVRLDALHERLRGPVPGETSPDINPTPWSGALPGIERHLETQQRLVNALDERIRPLEHLA